MSEKNLPNAAEAPQKPHRTIRSTLGWCAISLVLLILGAHFYRASEYGLTLCVLGILFFNGSSSPWKRYATALFLFWGGVEWLGAAKLLAEHRMLMGVPWVRGTAILVVVAFATFWASFYAFRLADKKEMATSNTLNIKQSSEQASIFQAIVFMAIFLLLTLIRQKEPFTMLLLERYLPSIGAVQIFFAAWYGSFIADKLLHLRKNRGLRKKIWLAFSIIFFAQLTLGLLGVPNMLMTGNLHIPVPGGIILFPIFRGDIGMMMILVLASVLLTGSAWCSLLCYFGGLDLSAAAISNKPVPAPNKTIEIILQYGRSIVLILGIVTALILRYSEVSIETATTFGLAFMLVGLLVIGIFSRKYRGMLHCTGYCPLGLIINLLAKISPWRIRVSKDCDNCGACEKICRSYAITERSRATGATLTRCTLCRDCTAICPQGALSVRAVCGSKTLSARMSAQIFVGLIVVLHVIFIMIARV